MLWKSAAADVVKKMFWEAASAETRERKDDTIKRLSYYHDEQQEYIIELLEKHHAEPDAFEPVYFNVTKKVINQLAMVYMASAQRQIVDGTTNDNSIFTEIVDSSNLDLKLKTASRYCQLLKTIMLRPVWRRGQMDLDVLTGDILDVEWGDSPEHITHVMVTHYPQSGETKDIEYSLWDEQTYRRLDYNGNTIESAPNPYGIIPFVPVWAQVPATGSFWVAGGGDLVSVQSAINAKLTDLMLVLRYQGFGVPVARGVPEDSLGQIGPNTCVIIPDPAGDFSFAKTQAPIAQTLAAIEFLAKNLAISNGLSAASMSVKPTQESGLSRISQSTELNELRKDQISLFGRYERQLFNMFKIVWNAHNPTKKITDTARLKIDFYDPRPVMSPDKQAELWQVELEMGTISRTDILMLKNPDLSKEDAIQKLEEIQAENDKYSPTEAQNQQEK